MLSVYDVYGVKTKIIESKLETINWMRMINPIIERYVLIIKNYSNKLCKKLNLMSC